MRACTWAAPRTSCAGPSRNSSRIWTRGAFVRIHRSIIVNLERVRGLELQESGEYEVVLDSKIRLKLSRRYRKRLQDRLDGL